MIDVEKIRKDFPILNTKINNRNLIYFDNAATTQKPLCVVKAIEDYYLKENANIHRAVHFLAQKATSDYEDAREKVREFIGAKEKQEIIFTRGTTESINLVANSFIKSFVKSKDNIIISQMEHHSNIVPWQLMQNVVDFQIRVLPMNDEGELQIDKLTSLIDSKTKLVSLTHVSNALGVRNDIEKVIEIAHKKNIPVLVDGAQAVPHFSVNVQDLDCDFYAFSGHKLYAPMGIGVLYGKREFLDRMIPYQGGGEMIEHVTFEKTTFNELPYKFEAGTPNVGDTIALKEAINYINNIGYKNIEEYEDELLGYCEEKLRKSGAIIYGKTPKRVGAISFNLENVHPFDVGTLLDQFSIAIRTGHHCAQTVMQHFNIVGTNRVSFAIYNTKDEIDLFIESLERVKTMLY
ncbi:MAG: cysteine desulfurase [Bacteroidales bacterium]|jgi:cysteine desulfurase/selenocysteine lyase|nr:cysteine desulfurase [Bacteroidales bacterium]